MRCCRRSCWRLDRAETVGAVIGEVAGGAGGVRPAAARPLRFDGNGNLTFEAGPHQGFNGDPTAIQEFCAALS